MGLYDSRSDADENVIGVAKRTLENYIRTAEISTEARLASFRLGADFHKGRPDPIRPQVASIFNRNMPVFLCVGTVEPRKNYGYVLDAFERLWGEGVEVGLCIVGRVGWMQARLLERLLDDGTITQREFEGLRSKTVERY